MDIDQSNPHKAMIALINDRHDLGHTDRARGRDVHRGTSRRPGPVAVAVAVAVAVSFSVAVAPPLRLSQTPVGPGVGAA
jgi:hypothetical protein